MDKWHAARRPNEFDVKKGPVLEKSFNRGEFGPNPIKEDTDF